MSYEEDKTVMWCRKTSDATLVKWLEEIFEVVTLELTHEWRVGVSSANIWGQDIAGRRNVEKPTDGSTIWNTWRLWLAASEQRKYWREMRDLNSVLPTVTLSWLSAKILVERILVQLEWGVYLSTC